MIGLSTQTFDVDGDLIIDEIISRSNITNLTRRINKVKTLDGNVAIEDRGFTHSDRSFSISLVADIDLRDILTSMIENHNSLTLTTADGGYSVAPISFDLKPGYFTLNFEAR